MKRILIAAFVVLIFFNGCQSEMLSEKKPLPVNQTQSDIERIELMYSDKADDWLKDKTVAAVLTGYEAEILWDELQEMGVKHYHNPSPHYFGKLAISIYYKDGNYDVLGTEMCGYYCEDLLYPKSYYYLDNEETRELFSRYMDVNLLPE